jgi:copper chaperone CopZ
MSVTLLEINGMGCATCVDAVEKALKAVPGVVSAEAWLEDRSAKVRHEGADESALVRAVEGEGYEARVVPQ